MSKWKWNQNWENRIYFALQVIFGNKMFQALKEGTGKFLGLFELGFYDLLMFFQIVAVFIIVRNCDWFGKKFKEFRQLYGWKTSQEKWEEQEKEKQAEWERERAEKEQLIDQINWTLVAVDAALDGHRKISLGDCDRITKATILRLKEFGFKVPIIPIGEEFFSKYLLEKLHGFLQEAKGIVRLKDPSPYLNIWEEYESGNRN